MWVAIIIVAFVGFWVYASASIRSRVFGRALCVSDDESLPRSLRADGTARPLLTFDDGPDAELTPRLLDVLDKHHAKAVFCVMGRKAELHPELLREMARRGHTIANHTYHHNPFLNFLGSGRLRDELLRTDAVIERATGSRPTLFRPPLGIRTHFTHSVARQTGHQVLGWSIRSLDTLPVSRQWVLRRVCRRLRGNSIVLLHDRLPGVVELADQILSKG